MNLRISEGRLRFRITREELARLQRGQGLKLALPLSSGGHHYGIHPGDFKTSLALREEAGRLTLMVDQKALASFEKQLPSREGIKQEVMVAGTTLTLMLEVDVRKSPKD